MNRILIVEDESSISDFVKGELEYEGYEVCIKEDGRDGLEEALNNEYDLVILDIMLPSMNGFEICRRIKRVKATPVIMLSAKSSVIDKVNGLKLGADDYISKPFAISELLARVRAMLRRKGEFQPDILEFSDVTLNKGTYELGYKDNYVRLVSREFQMLEMLMKMPGQVISTAQFMDKIWGWDSEVEVSIVWVYISNLRRKFMLINAPIEIRAIRGVGYCMETKNND